MFDIIDIFHSVMCIDKEGGYVKKIFVDNSTTVLLMYQHLCVHVCVCLIDWF